MYADWLLEISARIDEHANRTQAKIDRIYSQGINAANKRHLHAQLLADKKYVSTVSQIYDDYLPDSIWNVSGAVLGIYGIALGQTVLSGRALVELEEAQSQREVDYQKADSNRQDDLFALQERIDIIKDDHENFSKQQRELQERIRAEQPQTLKTITERYRTQYPDCFQ